MSRTRNFDMDEKYWETGTLVAAHLGKSSRQQLMEELMIRYFNGFPELLEKGTMIAEMKMGFKPKAETVAEASVVKEQRDLGIKFRFIRRDGGPDEFAVGEFVGYALESIHPGMNDEQFNVMFKSYEKI